MAFNLAQLFSGGPTPGNPSQSGTPSGPGGPQLDGSKQDPNSGVIPPNTQQTQQKFKTPDGKEVTISVGEPTKDVNASPLDTFQDLWKIDPKTVPSAPSKVFELDPKKVTDAANQIDFSAVVPKEVLAKISGGGQEAIDATQQALKITLSHLYATGSLTTANMIERALEKHTANLLGALPNLLKRHSLGESLREQNPALDHPAAKPVIESLQATLALKYPEASSQELKEMATDYLVGLSTLISRGSNKTETTSLKGKDGKPIKKEEDWSQFLPDYLK